MSGSSRGDGGRGRMGPAAALAMLAVAAVALAMAVSLFSGTDKMASPSSEDWMEVYFHQAQARQAFIEDLRPAFWSPYVNGGYPLAGHPYDPSLSPLFPLSLAAGELIAPRLNCLLAYLAGVCGMALFCLRVLRWSGPGAFGATALYAASGWLPAHFFGGNLNECFYFLFPLLLYFLARGREDRRFVFFGGLLLYLLLAEAKFAYPVSICFLFACWAVFSLSDPAREGRSSPGLKVLAAGLICSVLLGLFKLDLLAGLLSREPRIVSDYSLFLPPRNENPVFLLYMLSTWFRLRHFPADLLKDGQMFHDIDGQMLLMDNQYLGTGLLPLALLLLAAALAPRRFSGVAALFLLSLLLCLSTLSSHGLFDPLARLPLFSSIKEPAKYFSFFLLFFTCLGTGGFFDVLAQRLGNRGAAAALLMLAAGLPALMPALQNTRIPAYAFTTEIPAPRPAESFFQVDRGVLYMNLRGGFGIIDRWCGNIVLESRAVPAYFYEGNGAQGPEGGSGPLFRENPDYRGEAWLARGAGAAGLAQIRANRILARAVVEKGPALLVINQNFDPGWRAEGHEVSDFQGLLAIPLPRAGSYEIRMRFTPPGAGFWFAANCLSLLFLLALFFSPLGRKPPFSKLLPPARK